MVEKLDISEISASFGSHLARNDSFCSSSVEFMKLLYLADKSPGKDRDANIPSHSTLAEKGILLFDTNTTRLNLYQPINRKLTQLKYLIDFLPKCKYTAVCLKKFIFVLLPGKKVYRVNVWEAESSWTEMESMMNDHGENIRAAVHNNLIYVCGEYTMERFNNNLNKCMKWENFECSSIKPDESALVTFGDEIYVIGGYNRGKKVDKYSPSVGSWSSVKPMNVGRRTPAAAVYDDRIYVAGGWNRSSKLLSTEFFNPYDNTWTKVTSMTIQRFNFSLCVVNNNLFAVGNISGSYSIEKYDFDKNQWEKVTDSIDMEIMSAASIAVKIPLY
uniref:kelch-like protein diablo n=1 Tax=Styela clava TaxID=7725 RepID=UPI00193AB875|nr:kelch-like protein diablo [Styela clava]